jgi:hypothetical protein
MERTNWQTADLPSNGGGGWKLPDVKLPHRNFEVVWYASIMPRCIGLRKKKQGIIQLLPF